MTQLTSAEAKTNLATDLLSGQQFATHIQVIGTDGPDSLTGTSDADVIEGRGGRDILEGKAGDDLLYGGAGSDSLYGGDGSDLLDGGDGSDIFSDAVGADTILGGAGNDRIAVRRSTGISGAVAEAVIVDAGIGADDVSFSNNRLGSSVINLGAGDDLLFLESVTNGALMLTLGAGRDTIRLASYADTIGGVTMTDFATGVGGDVIRLDQFLGGQAREWINTTAPFGTSGYLRLLQSGEATLLQFDWNGATGGAQFETLITFANTTATSFTAENFDGYIPSVAAQAGAILVGTAGDDTLIGTTYDDTISGEAGNDSIGGGLGNDKLHGDGGDDSISGGAGDDLVDGGAGDDFLYGDAGLNELRGGAGNDFLKPANSFTMPGGDGVVDGGDGFDRISYFNEANGVAVDLRILTAQATGRGLHTITNVEYLSGTRFDDVLIGDDRPNVLWGSVAGNDILIGNGGDDLLAIGVGIHVVDGGNGSDTLGTIGTDGFTTGLTLSLAAQGVVQQTGLGTVKLSSIENLSGTVLDDRFTGDAVANILAGGDGSDTLVGGAGDDLLLGDGSISISTGPTGTSGPVVTMTAGIGMGADRLEGGRGNDVMWGGAGADSFMFNPMARGERDVIRDFGEGDRLLSTVKLTDSNNDGVIGFGKDRALDIGRGKVQVFSEAGAIVDQLVFRGEVVEDGFTYFVYGLIDG